MQTTPTREQLLRHAERYGCDQVYETGAEYFEGAELARLKIQLRKIAETHRKTRRSRPPEASTWFEGVPAVTDDDLRALHAEPLTPKEISLLAGVSARRVYRALEAGAEPTQSVNPSTEPSLVA